MEIIEMVDVTKLQDVKVKGREESVMIYDVKKCI
jgi:hypothetical protein